MSTPMPASRFFEPRESFLGYVKMIAKHAVCVYDVGAGQGHVAEALIEVGVAVVALDIAPRDGRGEIPVVHANGATYPYARGSVVMLCRPSHGPFASAVVDQAIRCGASAVLYVGLPKNRRADLDDFARRFKLELSRAGKDDERAWRYRVRDVDVLSQNRRKP